MRQKTLFPSLVALLCLVTACSDTDDGASAPEATGIKLSVETITFSDDALSQSIAVNSGTDPWCITAVATDDNKTLLSEAEQEAMRGGEPFERTFQWLTVAVEDNTIRLDAVESGFSAHTFSIELSSANGAARINGSQAAKTDDSPIVANPARVELYFKPDTATVETGKDTWWVAAVTIEGLDIQLYDSIAGGEILRPQSRDFNRTFDWLTVRVDGTRLVLIAQENEDIAPRHFSVVLSTGSQECEITGTQDVMPSGYVENNDGNIEATPDYVEFPPEGGTLRVEAAQSGWWFQDILVDGEYQDLGLTQQSAKDQLTKYRQYKRTFDWLTVELDSFDLLLTAQPNTTGSERTFEVLLDNYFEKGRITGLQLAQ